jgi:ribonucleoside-triphosphate reductase
MNVDYKLNKDFERCCRQLVDKYGEDFELLNGFHDSQLNFSDFLDSFVKKNLAEVSIDNNASSTGRDIVSLCLEKGKPSDKLIAFSKIFQEMKKRYGLTAAQEWLEMEWVGAFYMHDAPSTTYKPYCYAYDLSRLAKEGLFFMNNYNNEGPKHLTTFTDDLIEYVSFMCNRSSGAVGLPNVLLWTMYFWKKDIDNGYYLVSPDYYLRQTFEKFIYRLNQPFLRTDQCAFTNVSIFDKYYYEALFGDITFPDGTYAIDYVDMFIEHEKVFMEVVSKIRESNMFTFPVLTYSLLKRRNITQEEADEMLRTRKFNVFADNDFARWCSDHNTKWNDSNFFMSDDVTTLSNCCRLLSDTSKLKGFINSIGGTALSIGSIKVNTINLVRICYELEEAENLTENEYLKILRKRTKLCCKALDRVRHIITRNVEKGLLPNYCDGGIEIDKQYCTVGILGLYEVMVKFGYIEEDEFGNKTYTDSGLKFCDKIFKVLNEVKDNFTTDYSFNIESIPAERAAVVLCGKDSTFFNVNEFDLYSNQWIPLTERCTINEKIRTAAILDNKCSGGAIAHINLESNFPNTDEAWYLLNYIALSGVIYFCFNTRINVCKHRHAFVGTDTCPKCGEPVADTYQRVVGFLTPSDAYSTPRKKEFTARQWYEHAMLKAQSGLVD